MGAVLTSRVSGKCFLAEVQEKDLILSCQQGNLSAFEELVRRHRGKAYAIAYGIVRNRDDALDITQEALFRAYRSIRKFRRRAGFATWLRRIVVNLSIDHLRRSSLAADELLERAQAPSGAEPQHAIAGQWRETGEERALHRELGEAIDWAMRELNPQQRAAVILRDAQGLSYSEIARAMACSRGTVMSRIHYGRQKLRALLASYLGESS